MGSNFANDMATKDALDRLRLDVGLEQHLRYNHYPPFPACFLTTCKAAIAACADDEPDKEIALPEGYENAGLSEVPAHVIVNDFHLGPWVARAKNPPTEDEDGSPD